MRIGILTGGGDCPGLNAVIRAVVLTRRARATATRSIGYLDGWKGVLEDEYVPLDVRSVAATSWPWAAPSSGRRAPTPSRSRAAPSGCCANLAAQAGRRTGGHGRRGHPGRGPAPRGPRRQCRRCPEDHRQRPVGDRGHLRVRHRRADRHRRHRPPAHDGRVASPRHRVRGHGSPRRMDRHPRRDRRGCGGDPRARGPLRRRRRVRAAAATARAAASSRRSSSSPRVRSRSTAPTPTRRRLATSGAPVDQFGHARLGGIGAWLAEELERRHRASRHASRSWVTSSAAARRRPSTGSSPRASASPRWRPSTTGPSGRWWRCRRGEIVRVPHRRRGGQVEDRRPRPLPRRGRGVPGIVHAGRECPPGLIVIERGQDGCDKIWREPKPPETKYASSDGLSIAYQVSGAGPIDVVLVPGLVSHLEISREMFGPAHAFERYESFARLIRFDKRGTGLSDRVTGSPTLEERMDDVRAVMDAAGSERAALVGFSEGGPMSMLFAVSHPERTTALVLEDSFARLAWAPDYPGA